jgi:ABC-type antimicrobial peptide transport system permease subunit
MIKHPSRFPSLILRIFLGPDEYLEKAGDLEEVCSCLVKEVGPFRARVWFCFQVLRLVPVCVVNSIFWRYVMFKNYFKIALRNSLNNKMFSSINLSGLAIGMACCILISINVLNELNYNHFHENLDRLYGVVNDQYFEGEKWHISATPFPLGPALKEEFPEVIASTRYSRYYETLVSYKDKSFYESRIYHVDPDFFSMFSFSFIAGDKSTALNDPNSIILTKNIVEKYFSNEHPIGKTLRINNEYNFTVTGVMEDPPYNSSLRFDILIPTRFVEGIYQKKGYSLNWSSNDPQTFIQLLQKNSAEVVNSKIRNYVRIKAENKNAPEFLIVPLKDFRFSPYYGGSDRMTYLSILSLIAVFILLMACVNFMNLSTARSAKRAKEIGMRKVMGAYRKNLIFQFLGESLILSFASLLFAVMLVVILLPAFNAISGHNLPIDVLRRSFVIPVLIGVTLITGLIGGSYPALFLSSFRPIMTLKGNIKTGTKNVFSRKILIVFQFVLSISLIIGTSVIFKQLDYMKNTDQGFDAIDLISIPLRTEIRQNYTSLKNSLLQNPGIINITGSVHSPSHIERNTTDISWEGKNPDNTRLIHISSVDYNYLETMKIDLVAGRKFSKEFPADFGKNYLINEAMVRNMGVDNPVGMKLEGRGDPGRIIGVIKDFHFLPLYDQIPPLVIKLDLENIRYEKIYMFVRIDPNNIPATLNFIKEKWDEIIPSFPFEYTFLENDLELRYGTEERLGHILRSFTWLAVFIACLGLFGLAAFTAERRTKEIGIRKVLGASVPNVVFLISKEFLFLVIASNIIAWPLSFIVMNNWLQDFAYRTSITIWTLILPTLLAVMLTIITVCFHSIKSGYTNPTDCLRYE